MTDVQAGVSGEPPAPTWLLSIASLKSQIESFQNNNVLLTGLTPALAAVLAHGKKLPPPFIPQTQGKDHSLGVQCLLHGETGTPLEHGKWEMEVFFPIEYPWQPPTFHLVTPFFHPDLPLPLTEQNKTTSVKMKSSLFAKKSNTTDYPDYQTEVDSLCKRLRAAKKHLAPIQKTPPSITPSLKHLAAPSLTVTFTHIDGGCHPIQISTQDTQAGLKLRYAAATNWLFSNEDLVCKGHILTGASELQDNDQIFLVRKMYTGPSGPFKINEVHSVNKSNARQFSFDINQVHGAVQWLNGVVEMREWLHTSHLSIREDMMIHAGTQQCDMKWNPWVAVWDRDAVRNLRAGVLLAEGKMNEYAKEVKRFTLKYAVETVIEEPLPPPVVAVAVGGLPPPPPPPSFS